MARAGFVTTGLWAKIHKWLALLMAVQILFWFASGLFFAWFPIERVRSEHAKGVVAERPVPLDEAAAGLARLRGAGVGPADAVEIRRLLGQPVALVRAGEGRPILYDLGSGRRLSPVPMTLAARIAEADHVGDLRAARVSRVESESTEYKGALPAWRVDFEDGEGRAVYVAADTGVVTARRSTLWRTYDFLWGLHIMDWRGHEDFNTWLLVIATVLGLVVIVSGLVMLPGRLGLTRWLRRRRGLSLRSHPGAGRDP